MFCKKGLAIDAVVGFEDFVEEEVLIFFPPIGREDFDFAEAAEFMVTDDPLIDFGKVGATFAHDASVEEHVGGLGFVVADMIGS